MVSLTNPDESVCAEREMVITKEISVVSTKVLISGNKLQIRITNLVNRRGCQSDII